MSRSIHALILSLLLAVSTPLLAANACRTGGAATPADGSGSGGTGLSAMRDSGSGGTGQIAQDSDASGSGGTGQTVEVEGVITGFASICVNGLELHYNARTPVLLDGRDASSRELAIGQIVRVQARGLGNQLRARRVDIRYLLVAPLQSRSATQLRVMGQSIALNPGAPLAAGLQPGMRIAISGVRGVNGKITATRIDRAADNAADSLSGEIKRTADGQFHLNGVTLRGNANALRAGERVRVEGRYTKGSLRVEHLARDTQRGQAERVVIQGIARSTGKSTLDVAGRQIRLDRRSRPADTPRAGQWVTIDALREGKILHAREVEIQENPLPTRLESGYPEREGRRHTTPTGQRNDAGKSHAEETRRADRPGKPDAMDKADKPGRVEHLERPEKADRLERPENREKPERIEKPERPERRAYDK